jgi:hypothetical protein
MSKSQNIIILSFNLREDDGTLSQPIRVGQEHPPVLALEIGKLPKTL